MQLEKLKEFGICFFLVSKGFKMTTKNNLSFEERQIRKGLKEDTSIIICSADKGKAVVVEDIDTYTSHNALRLSILDLYICKMQQQINIYIYIYIYTYVHTYTHIYQNKRVW